MHGDNSVFGKDAERKTGSVYSTLRSFLAGNEQAMMKKTARAIAGLRGDQKTKKEKNYGCRAVQDPMGYASFLVIAEQKQSLTDAVSRVRRNSVTTTSALTNMLPSC